MSWMVLLRTCPSVSTPVTFGGGMTIEYGGFGEFGSATKNLFSSQYWYHRSSTDCGSYALESSDITEMLRVALALPEPILDAVHERLEARLDDVLAHAHGAPFILA